MPAKPARPATKTHDTINTQTKGGRLSRPRRGSDATGSAAGLFIGLSECASVPETSAARAPATACERREGDADHRERGDDRQLDRHRRAPRLDRALEISTAESAARPG